MLPAHKFCKDNPCKLCSVADSQHQGPLLVPHFANTFTNIPASCNLFNPTMFFGCSSFATSGNSMDTGQLAHSQ